MEVDKAEHHYETIFNVVKAAVASTHLPTLGLAVLAFLIMIVLKRLNRNAPNVLVAVVVTTLISWGTGFQRNRTIELDRIESAEVTGKIEEYNENLREKAKNDSLRVEINARYKAAVKAHGAHSVTTLKLEHNLALVNLKLKEINEYIRFLRSELRGFRFTGVTGSDGGLTLFLKGEIPREMKRGGRTWRLKVSNRPLNENALIIIGGGVVVGEIPRGLPELSVPKLNLAIMLELLPMAVVISLLGFMEAISIAKAMAAKTGQRLDPNQELIGQGLANIVGSFGRSYPVSGSFSRSAVNIQAGAVTGMSSVFSSLVVVMTLLFFTPLLYYLPQSVLAAIIMMAVIGLVNVKGFVHAFQAQRYDGVIAVISFVFTLAFAPHLDRGIMIGVVLSLGTYLFRSMKPDMAILSRYVDGTFRDADRRKLHKCAHIAVVRFNDSLFFANVNYLEEKILQLVSSMPKLKHIHLVGNAINELDASGEEMLAMLVTRLREAGYDVSVSGLNESVLDVMKRTHLYEKLGEDHIFGNVQIAVRRLYDRTHQDTDEVKCPLLEVCMKGLPIEDEYRGIATSRGGED